MVVISCTSPSPHPRRECPGMHTGPHAPLADHDSVNCPIMSTAMAYVLRAAPTTAIMVQLAARAGAHWDIGDTDVLVVGTPPTTCGGRSNDDNKATPTTAELGPPPPSTNTGPHSAQAYEAGLGGTAAHLVREHAGRLGGQHRQDQVEGRGRGPRVRYRSTTRCPPDHPAWPPIPRRSASRTSRCRKGSWGYREAWHRRCRRWQGWLRAGRHICVTKRGRST